MSEFSLPFFRDPRGAAGDWLHGKLRRLADQLRLREARGPSLEQRASLLIS